MSFWPTFLFGIFVGMAIIILVIGIFFSKDNIKRRSNELEMRKQLFRYWTEANQNTLDYIKAVEDIVRAIREGK